jgi:GNAT superfamily N-acetyltransferase
VLQRCDVGHRVVVRQSVSAGENGRPLFTDVLGELVELDDARIVVRKDDGTDWVVALADVAAAKRIPPRPARYSEIATLERAADRAWRAPDTELLGEWLLRAADGFTNRANSALPVGDPGMDLDEAIDACVRWYLGRTLTPRITVPLPLRRDVARALLARGWVGQPPVLVQAATLADVLAAPGAPPRSEGGGWSVELSRRPSPGFLKIITARKAGLPAVAGDIITGGVVQFAEITEPAGAAARKPWSSTPTPGGSTGTAHADPTGIGTARPTGPSAIARACVVDEWMHLGLVEVLEPARRRGWARAVTQALAAWARAEGASRSVLQVEEHNTAAVRLYGGLGYRTHHTYVTYRFVG